MHAAKIITKPEVDANAFLSTVFELTGRKIADKVDASGRGASTSHKVALWLAEWIGCDSLIPTVLGHLSFSCLVLFETDDAPNILQAAGDLKWLGTDTMKRGCTVGLLTGDLNQWSNAITNGLADPITNPFFQSVKSEFRVEGFLC